MKPVVVLGAGSAAPSLRLAASEVGAAWGAGGGRGGVAVCDADEDTLTLAWRAGRDALAAAGVAAGAVDGLWWGTARPPFAEGPSHAFLSTALGCRPDVEGALTSGSPHAGMEALAAAWDAVAAGHVEVALVVASDALVPGLGTAGESRTGAGAAALVVRAPGDAGNGTGGAARLVGRVTRTLPVLDRYRPDAGGATEDVYDGRLFREEVYLPLLAEVGRAAAGTATVGAWAASDPDGKLAGALAKRLGAGLASAPVQAALGDTGAAAPLLGLIEALAAGAEGSTTAVVGAIGYGGGRASAVTVEVGRPVPGARPVAALGPGRPAAYVEVLRARGQLEPLSEPIPMGVPPGGAAFVRGNIEMLALQGARCEACGTISTPPSIHPTCIGCGGAALTVVPLARTGRVQTFVVNQTMPPPFQAPLPLVVVDLDDGARLMVQGSPVDAATLAVGDEVVLSLYRYALERGVPVYGYKALRRGTDDAGASGADGAGGRPAEEARR
ncbi:MAG TPA: OB-fold domain-containing protein [Acidimicrobiales bacterium]|nr:OB-fold domain-containing protein [Acidimicrobiales bacterium]